MDGRTGIPQNCLIWRTIYGLFLGVLVNFYFVDYHSPLMLGIVVGTSIFTSMSIACLVASVFPVLLEKLKIDLALSTGPFVTTFIDIIGVSSYFLIAGSLFPV